jgi:hypothetical protein
MPVRALVSVIALVSLGGCDLLDGGATQAAAKAEADGRAVGGACRHAVRSIEDCYASYPRLPKASIFDGWREMDGYMRENNLQGMPSAGAAPASAASAAPAEGTASEPRAAGGQGTTGTQR